MIYNLVYYYIIIMTTSPPLGSRTLLKHRNKVPPRGELPNSMQCPHVDSRHDQNRHRVHCRNSTREREWERERERKREGTEKELCDRRCDLKRPQSLGRNLSNVSAGPRPRACDVVRRSRTAIFPCKIIAKSRILRRKSSILRGKSSI